MKQIPRSSLGKPGRKDICNRPHSVSVAFPVDVGEATLVKQGDLWPCNSMNIDMISKGVF
jgi:hypothetical protein